MRVVLRKSVADEICRYWGFPLVKSVYNPRDPKFEYFKRKIIAHLEKLERQEKAALRKAIIGWERLEKAASKKPREKAENGTVRTWGNGKKYRRIAPGKWVQVFDSESRGAKLSIAAIKRKADACKTSMELLQLTLKNRERFVDKWGFPLAIVDELHEYLSKRNDEIEAGIIDKPQAKAEKQRRIDSMSAADLEKIVQKNIEQLKETWDADEELKQLNNKLAQARKELHPEKGWVPWEEMHRLSDIISQAENEIITRKDAIAYSTKYHKKIIEASGYYQGKITKEKKNEVTALIKKGFFEEMTVSQLSEYMQKKDKEKWNIFNNDIPALKRELSKYTKHDDTHGSVIDILQARIKMLETLADTSVFFAKAAAEEIEERKRRRNEYNQKFGTERQARIEKESDEALKRASAVKEFDFVKSGQLKDADLKYFARDYERITPEHRAFLEKYARHMKANFYYKKKNENDPEAFYKHSDKTIYMNAQRASLESKDADFATDMVTFLHESGHWLDYNVLKDGSTIRSHLPDLRSLLKQDFFDFINKLVPDEPIKTIKGFDSAKHQFKLRDFLRSKDKFGFTEPTPIKASISDIMYGLTKSVNDGLITWETWAHNKSYWKKDALECEAVAEFFEARATDSERLSIAKEIFPSAYKYFEDFIKTL